MRPDKHTYLAVRPRSCYSGAGAVASWSKTPALQGACRACSVVMNRVDSRFPTHRNVCTFSCLNPHRMAVCPRCCCKKDPASAVPAMRRAPPDLSH